MKNENDIKVSIIVPIYNAALYLTPCIESILNQTLKDIELILVNDGSKDGSAQIISNYAKKDNRIKVINQKNLGVSAARNSGLLLAKGKFIGFVDADDTIEADYFEQLYKASDSMDIVVSRLNQAVLPPKIFDKNAIQKEIIPKLIQGDTLNAVWLNLYNRDFLFHSNVLFPTKVTNGEDQAFNMQAFNMAQNVKSINYKGYNYNEVMNSATNNCKGKNYFHQALDHFNRPLPKNDYYTAEELLFFKEKRFFNTIISLVHIYGNCTAIPFVKRFNYIKKILKNNLTQTVFKNKNLYIDQNKNHYIKAIVFCIEKRLTLGLFLLLKYSFIKNK